MKEYLELVCYFETPLKGEKKVALAASLGV